MINIRYVNAWECKCCYALYPTERKAIICFNLHNNYESDPKWDYSNAKAILIKGFECLDCMKLHKNGLEARQCCNYEYPHPKDKENYNLIGKHKPKQQGKLLK